MQDGLPYEECLSSSRHPRFPSHVYPPHMTITVTAILYHSSFHFSTPKIIEYKICLFIFIFLVLASYLNCSKSSISKCGISVKSKYFLVFSIASLCFSHNNKLSYRRGKSYLHSSISIWYQDYLTVKSLYFLYGVVSYTCIYYAHTYRHWTLLSLRSSWHWPSWIYNKMGTHGKNRLQSFLHFSLINLTRF